MSSAKKYVIDTERVTTTGALLTDTTKAVVQAKLGTYDPYKAREQFYAETTKILQEMPKSQLLDPIIQHQAVKRMLAKVEGLGLKGTQFEIKQLEARTLNYCTNMTMNEIKEIVENNITTIRKNVQKDYNRRNQSSPSFVQSSGDVKLFLENHRKGVNNIQVGAHVVINPINLFSEAKLPKQKKLQENVSNSLKAFYKLLKNKNHGFTKNLISERNAKYLQIVDFFMEGYDIECLSFDFMFNGQQFKDQCLRGNPFNSGIMEYLDLSFDYAEWTINFMNPVYKQRQVQEPVRQNILQENKSIIRWKAYKNIHCLLEMLSESKQIKKLKKLNLSSMNLTEKSVTALQKIMENGDLQYLNLAGCCFTEQGITILHQAFKYSKTLTCLILDDICVYERHVRPTGCLFCASKDKFLCHIRISDSNIHLILQEINMEARNLAEFYFNWNSVPRRYLVSKKNILIERLLDEELARLDLGPIGSDCLDIINSILFSNENLAICQIRNNQLPFDKIQQLAIALKSSISILQLELSGNTEIFSSQSTFCCKQRSQASRRIVLSSVLTDAKKSCDAHNNNPIFDESLKQITTKYNAYLTSQLSEEQKLKKQKLEEERKKQERLQKEKKEREEAEAKEHQKKLELNKAAAAQVVNHTNLNQDHSSHVFKVGTYAPTTTSIDYKPVSYQNTTTTAPMILPNPQFPMLLPGAAMPIIPNPQTQLNLQGQPQVGTIDQILMQSLPLLMQSQIGMNQQQSQQMYQSQIQQQQLQQQQLQQQQLQQQQLQQQQLQQQQLQQQQLQLHLQQQQQQPLPQQQQQQLPQQFTHNPSNIPNDQYVKMNDQMKMVEALVEQNKLLQHQLSSRIPNENTAFVAQTSAQPINPLGDSIDDSGVGSIPVMNVKIQQGGNKHPS